MSYFMQLRFWLFNIDEESFTKALRSFETCALVNNNLCKKLFSSLESPTTFDEYFKVTSVLFFLDLMCYIESFCINVILKQHKL